MKAATRGTQGLCTIHHYAAAVCERKDRKKIKSDASSPPPFLLEECGMCEKSSHSLEVQISMKMPLAGQQ